MRDIIPKYNNKINCIEVVKPLFKDKDIKIINDFLIFCGGSAGKESLKKYHRNMIKLCDVFEGDLDKIDLKRLRDFLQVLNNSDLLPPTKNELKKVLKRFLKEHYDDWSSRFKNFSDKAFKQQSEINQDKINANTILRSQEIEELIRGTTSLKYKAFIILMYETAGRPEEILKLQWKDINLVEGDVKLKSSKTGNLRINPIQESITHLKRHREEYPFVNVCADDYVFPCPYDRTKQQTLPSVGMYLKRLGRDVLKRDIFPYLIRHTRATELQKVLPPKVYEKFMDHSLETATRYEHLNKKDVKDIMFEKVYKVEEIKEDKKHELEKQIEHIQQQILTLNRKYKFVKRKKILTKEQAIKELSS